jgi:hypothetical protein
MLGSISIRGSQEPLCLFFVDAKNKEAKGYYEPFGFISLSDSPLEFFLPIATLQQAYESIVEK